MAKYPRQVVIHNPLWEFMRYCEVYCNYACCGEAAFEVHHALILRKVIDENLGGGHGDQSFELAWRQLRDLIVFLDTTELINLDHGLPIWSEEETEFPQYWVSKDSYQSWLETWNDAFEKASSYMAPNSEASLYEKDKVGHLDKFKSDREFIEFLNDHKIPAVASSHAHSSSLTWWQDEQHEGLFDVALLNGDFFLLATDKTLELYVLDFNSCWFDLVKVWQRNISKHIFAYELRKIIYEVDKDIWFHVRKTGLDRGLKKKLDKIGIEQLPPDLRERVMDFQAGLDDFPGEGVHLKQATLELLNFLLNDQARTPEICLFLQKYFPTLNIVIENLPERFRGIVRQIGKSFENNQTPDREMINNLIKRVETL